MAPPLTPRRKPGNPLQLRPGSHPPTPQRSQPQKLSFLAKEKARATVLSSAVNAVVKPSFTEISGSEVLPSQNANDAVSATRQRRCLVRPQDKAWPGKPVANSGLCDLGLPRTKTLAINDIVKFKYAVFPEQSKAAITYVELPKYCPNRQNFVLAVALVFAIRAPQTIVIATMCDRRKETQWVDIYCSGALQGAHYTVTEGEEDQTIVSIQKAGLAEEIEVTRHRFSWDDEKISNRMQTLIQEIVTQPSNA